MKEFLHNKEKVVYQEIQDQSFLDILNKSGIIPEEVPDDNMNYRVFKYEKNGENRYACVLGANAPDTYIEKVYITFKYPEDGFYNMMLDVAGQLDGEQPKQCRSRLSIAAEQAAKKAQNWAENQYPDREIDWVLTEYQKDIQAEYNEMYKLALNSFGYYLDTLDKISAPDVDLDYMREMLK